MNWNESFVTQIGDDAKVITWSPDYAILRHHVWSLFLCLVRRDCIFANYFCLSYPPDRLVDLHWFFLNDNFVRSPGSEPFALEHSGFFLVKERVHGVSETIVSQNRFFFLACAVEIEIADNHAVIFQIILCFFQQVKSHFHLVFPDIGREP